MERHLLRSLPALVLAATVLYTISVYPELPARMPTHFGINGQPNGWSSREFGAWILPAVMALLWALSAVLPMIDPRKANYEKFGVTYHLAITAIIAFQGVIQWAVLNVALGRPVNINTVIYVSLGALFAVLGVAMPFTKPTTFFGVRTKWTLSDDTVWARTHKTAGLLMVVAGVLTVYSALTATPQITFMIMVTATMAAAIGSVLISYVYWRQR